MSSHRVSTDVLLVPWASDSWTAWCPAVDTCSQGENPDHALGMITEALSIVFSDDLLAFSHSDGVKWRKRVTHPLRRGRQAHVSSDEHWPAYQDYLDHRGAWVCQASVTVADLIPEMGVSVVLGDVSVDVRGGIVQATPSIYHWASVPARRFEYTVRTVHEHIGVVTVPAALLKPDAPLRRSGLSAMAIARSWIKEDNVVDWSVREKPIE